MKNQTKFNFLALIITLLITAGINAQTCIGNLLQNPSFESGFSNWQGSVGEIVTTVVNSGSKSLKMCNLGNRRQTLPATVGYNYKFQYTAKTAGVNQNILFGLKFLSASYQPLATEYSSFDSPTGFSSNFIQKVAPVGTVWVEVSIIKENAGCVYVDDVCLVKNMVTPTNTLVTGCNSTFGAATKIWNATLLTNGNYEVLVAKDTSLFKKTIDPAGNLISSIAVTAPAFSPYSIQNKHIIGLGVNILLPDSLVSNYELGAVVKVSDGTYFISGGKLINNNMSRSIYTFKVTSQGTIINRQYIVGAVHYTISVNSVRFIPLVSGVEFLYTINEVDGPCPQIRTFSTEINIENTTHNNILGGGDWTSVIKVAETNHLYQREYDYRGCDINGGYYDIKKIQISNYNFSPKKIILNRETISNGFIYLVNPAERFDFKLTKQNEDATKLEILYNYFRIYPMNRVFPDTFTIKKYSTSDTLLWQKAILLPYYPYQIIELPNNEFAVFGIENGIGTMTRSSCSLQNGTNTCSPDVTAPTILNCPANINEMANQGQLQGTRVYWTAPNLTDNCTGAVAFTTTQNSGATFPIGSSIVTYTAKDLANNTSICSFTVTVTQQINSNKADIILANLTIPSTSIAQNDAINYIFDLKNIGDVMAAGDYTIGAYLSTDNIWSPNDVQVGVVNTGNTPVGSIPMVNGGGIIPLAQPTGTYCLILKADLNNTIVESNENNNILVSSVTIKIIAGTVACSPCTYCSSKGDFPWQEWLAGVKIGSVNKTSGKSQYSDFTTTTFSLVKNVPSTVNLTNAFSYFTSEMFYKVWIDYNHNGVFEEPAEIFIQKSVPAPPVGTSANLTSVNATIPLSAQIGTTRMRVALKKGSYPTPCETFARGEVEDYSVDIAPNLTAGVVRNLQTLQGLEDLVRSAELFPNPAGESVFIKLPVSDAPVSISIYNQMGILEKEFLLSPSVGVIQSHTDTVPSELDLSDVKNGVYFLKIAVDDERTVVKKLVVSRMY